MCNVVIEQEHSHIIKAVESDGGRHCYRFELWNEGDRSRYLFSVSIAMRTVMVPVGAHQISSEGQRAA